MKGFLRLCLIAAAGASGCVDLPVEGGRAPVGVGITRPDFQPLDPGAKTLASLHFEVRAYGSDRTAQVSSMAEGLYSSIMNDTGLFSFMPRELYPVVIYASKEEFLRKTGLPAWSAGVAAGNAIYTYSNPDLPGILAHEMTHLIFYEFMGRFDASHRWVNEGLAVYEERKARVASGLPVAARPGSPIPFSQMALLAPLSEQGRDVSAWYWQVGDVVGFMIERGGRLGFSQFLKTLRDGRPVDEAVRRAYPGRWDGLNALEADWRGLR